MYGGIGWTRPPTSILCVVEQPMDVLALAPAWGPGHSFERLGAARDSAEVSGFRSGLNLRRAWNRQWGGSPRDARRAELPVKPLRASPA